MSDYQLVYTIFYVALIILMGIGFYMIFKDIFR